MKPSGSCASEDAAATETSIRGWPVVRRRTLVHATRRDDVAAQDLIDEIASLLVARTTVTWGDDL
jgi:hypothetical protein